MTILHTDFELDILKYEFTIRSGNRIVAALLTRSVFMKKWKRPWACWKA